MVGLPGTELSDGERAVLERVRPAGVILFARNFESLGQSRELMAALRDLERRPFVTTDLEGGLVNRLTRLWGDLPSAAAAAEEGRRAVRALGEAAGGACRHLGIQLDLAPVVDLACSGACLAGQGRCLGDDPERVVALAEVFADGLDDWGVTGCVKHYPGLGPIPADTHDELPALDLSERELAPQLGVFESLSARIPVVMVAHVVVPALGDPDRPASLSRAVVDRAISLPGSPVVLSDDLEMGALDGSGGLPERTAAALRARIHGACVCKSFDRLEEIAEHLDELAEDSAFDACVAEAAARLGTLRRDVQQRAAAVPAPDPDTVEQLWERARKAVA